MPNNNGRLNAQRLRTESNPAFKAASVAAGAVTGVAGSMGGVLGKDPRRASVPANSYGKKNKAFGKAYDITSAPGSAVAKGYKAIGRALR